ncbi:MAG: inositol monophosphatase [Chloroflexi bacterium]|nr:inositol monophosphatase [Chloroflexota bacterium]
MRPTLDFIKDIAVNAGGILKNFSREDLNIAEKNPKDLVTQADFASERYLIDAIQAAFPEHAIFAEESGKSAGSKDHQWFIDPLDGTLNYAHGVPFYAVSIGYALKGRMQLAVVYDPERDELYCAERGQGATLNEMPIQVAQRTKLATCMLVTGFPTETENPMDDNMANFLRFNSNALTVRRLGSAALDAVYVAAGRLDGYWDAEISLWDIAAGGLIASEADAAVTDVFGNPDYMGKQPSSIVCANPVIHQQMLDLLAATREARGAVTSKV